MFNVRGIACITTACAAIFASAALADPSDDIAWIATAEINEGASLKDVDALVARVTEAVAANVGTLAFDIARAGDTLFIYERLDNPEALMRHAEIVMPFMPEMQALWTTSHMVPTRSLPEDIEAMLVNFGATIPDNVSAVSR